MLIYDVDKIENLYKDFEKVKKNFINKEYDDFKSSYFYKCSDSVIVKLRNRFQTIYNNIQKGYDMIDKVWKEYVDDVGNFDKSIASGGNCGIHDGGVNSIVSKMCSIELYDSAGAGTYFKSIAASGNSIFAKIGNVLKRTAATIINTTIFAVTSGAIKLVESIVDCAVLIVGAVIGLPVLLFDGIKSLVNGKKDFSNSKKYYNGLIKVVGYDVAGTIKDKFYSTKFGKWFNDNSYGPFKKDGIGYKVTEVVSEIVGIVVITIFTCGGGGAAIGAAKTAGTAGTKLTVGMLAKTAIKGGAAAIKTAAVKGVSSVLVKGGTTQLAAFAVRAASATGTNVQSGYQKLLANGAEEGNLSGKDMAKLIGTSAAKGVADGAIYSLAYCNGLGALKNSAVAAKSKVVSTVSKGVNKLKSTNIGQKITSLTQGSGKTSIKETLSKVTSKLSPTNVKVGAKNVMVKVGNSIKGSSAVTKIKNGFNVVKESTPVTKAANKIDDIVTAVGDKVDEVKELKPFLKQAVKESKAGQAVSALANKASSTKTIVKDKIDDVVTAVGDKSDEVKELKPFLKQAVKESKAGQAVSALANKASSTKTIVKDKIDDVVTTIGDKVDETKEFAKIVSEPAKSTVKHGINTVKEGAKTVATKAIEPGKAALNKGKEIIGKTTTKITDGIDDVKELANYLKEPVKNSVSSAIKSGKDTVKETVKIISESEKVIAAKNATKTIVNNSNKAAIIMPGVDDFTE